MQASNVEKVDFSERKLKLLAAYEKILNSDVLFSGGIASDIEKDHILERRDSLKEHRYTVAICGQIKSGKSTLLNALLFGEPVLPADHTPHTAKITCIRHGDPSYEVTFYTKEEFDELYHSTDEVFQENFRNDVDASLNAGLIKDDLVGSVPHKGSNLNDLFKYVAKNGTYTPFVKEVAIFHPSKWLLDADFVDTPGTNDSNPVRDRVTKEWIHRADAVVYCTYSGRLFDQNDCDFIDNFLFGVPSKQRLFAATKIDIIDKSNRNALDAYLQKVVDCEMNRVRNLIDSVDSIYPVCQLASLIRAMEEKSVPLPDDIAHAADDLDENGFLEDKEDGIESLRKGINLRLLQNRGLLILRSHSTFLVGLFQRRVRHIQSLIQNAQQKAESLKCDIEELHHRHEAIRKSKEAMNVVNMEFESTLEILLSEQHLNFHLALNGIAERLSKAVNVELNSCEKCSDLKSSTWKVADTLSSVFLPEFKKTSMQFSKDIAKDVKCKLDYYNDRIPEEISFVCTMLECQVQHAFNDCAEDVHAGIEDKFSLEEMEKVFDECIYTLKGLLYWRKEDQLEQFKKNIAINIKKWALDYAKELADKVNNECRNQNQKLVSRLEEKVKLILEEEQDSLNELIEGKVNREKRRDELLQKIDNLKNEENNIIRFEKELNL